jgi:hypothetical protein
MDYDQNRKVSIHMKVLYFFTYLNVLFKFRVTATTATIATTAATITAAAAAAANQLMLFNE